MSGVRATRHIDSPRVRRLAREQHVDLAHVRRSGRHGRATAADVAAAAAPAASPTPATAPAPAPAPRAPAGSPGGRVEILSRHRRIVADQMLESLRVSAQLTTVVEVDLSRVSRVRTAAMEEFRRNQVPLTVLAFVAEAAVHALASNVSVNARLDLAAGTVTYPSAVHLGVAVDTDAGLLVPVVPNADDLSVAGLARGIADVAERSRRGAITADELSGGTFTISNTGSRGALFDTPIITQPQSAVLGFGAITRRPVVVQDSSGADLIAIRSMAYLALTYDHRLVDGAAAARYLGTVKERLEGWDVNHPVLALAQEVRT